MTILLDIIYLLLSVFYLPSFLFKRKHRIGLRQRFGIYSPKILNRLKKEKFPVWVHAVSVGEIKTAGVLIEQLRLSYPKIRFVISTITPTGNSIAEKIASKDDLVIYFPFDLSWIVKKIIALVNPKLIIIMETELWPNMISQAAKRGIRLVIANGRISDKAFPYYRAGKMFFRSVIRNIDLLCMQTDKDKKRVIQLGARPQRVKVTGNMKFDQIKKPESKTLPDIGLKANQRLIIAGSTHDNEEEILARVFLKLKDNHNNIRLLIAPRHPERALAVKQMLKKYGLKTLLISRIESGHSGSGSDAVYLLDVMGMLGDFYKLADIVFIGGSLVKHGGQNPIEPASCGKAVIFGQHMFNFQEIKKLFLTNKAALSVSNEEELYQALRELIVSKDKKEELAKRAKALVETNTGAVDKIMRLLKEAGFLKS